jgi:sortase A
MTRRTRTSKARRWIEALLLLAGLMAVGIWGWSYVRRAVYQTWENHVLDHRIKSQPPVTPQAEAPVPLRNGAVIGRLTIPRLHVRSVVREGAGQDTLEVALGHIPGTALPGQPGNAGIAGHRDTLFRSLRKIAKDDLIEFQTPTGSYSYQVESTDIVKPSDVTVLRASQHPEITLVTCYPFYYVGSAPDRFIVKARLLDTPSTSAPPPAATPSHDREAAVAPAKAKPSRPAIRQVSFRVSTQQSRELAPGILLHLTTTDTARRRANGWLYMPQEDRTIWLWNQAAHQPISFRVPAHGQQRELTITSVTGDSATGYLTSVDQ